MFCIYCGCKNPEGAKFCLSCGKEIGSTKPKANVWPHLDSRDSASETGKSEDIGKERETVSGQGELGVSERENKGEKKIAARTPEPGSMAPSKEERRVFPNRHDHEVQDAPEKKQLQSTAPVPTASRTDDGNYRVRSNKSAESSESVKRERAANIREAVESEYPEDEEDEMAPGDMWREDSAEDDEIYNEDFGEVEERGRRRFNGSFANRNEITRKIIIIVAVTLVVIVGCIWLIFR
jgi:hypothetical protein